MTALAAPSSETLRADLIETPIGVVVARFVEHEGCQIVAELRFSSSSSLGDPPPLKECSALRERLRAYFDRREADVFDELELAPRGTAFQHRVWAALRRVPFGETISYGELASRVGSPGAARAVGLANARNPIAIVIPCHRVLDSRGRLHGYAYGLERKRRLLEHEGTANTLGPCISDSKPRHRELDRLPANARLHASPLAGDFQ
jgi:methylated-DNA-[protein]-cysteine S-methyltransferase